MQSPTTTPASITRRVAISSSRLPFRLSLCDAHKNVRRSPSSGGATPRHPRGCQSPGSLTVRARHRENPFALPLEDSAAKPFDSASSDGTRSRRKRHVTALPLLREGPQNPLVHVNFTDTRRSCPEQLVNDQLCDALDISDSRQLHELAERGSSNAPVTDGGEMQAIDALLFAYVFSPHRFQLGRVGPGGDSLAPWLRRRSLYKAMRRRDPV